MPLAIDTRELTKVYPTTQGLLQRWRTGHLGVPVTAVDRVDLTVEEGELFGLLGPNGAGKTTLVKMLCTLIWPTTGTVLVAGFDLADAMSIRQVISLAVSDERSFYWRLTGRQNLEFYTALYNIQPADCRGRIDEVLRWLDLTDKAEQRFSNYSSGQKQRLAIARAVLHRPRLLFMDEPTRSLDPQATQQIHRFVREELVGREGMTVFLTTHRLDEAEKLCQRIAIMHQGRIRACGTFAQLQTHLQPQTRYRLRVKGLPTAAHRDAVSVMGATLSTDGSGGVLLEMDAPDGELALARAIRWLSDMGAEVRGVEEDRLSLEKVFQRFTQS